MASSHDVCAAALVAWARSPSTVMDRFGERRPTIRNSMADRSWASSTTTCPNTLATPAVRAWASSSNARSALVQRSSFTDAALLRRSNCCSSALSTPAAADAMALGPPSNERMRAGALMVGHSLSNSALNSLRLRRSLWNDELWDGSALGRLSYVFHINCIISVRSTSRESLVGRLRPNWVVTSEANSAAATVITPYAVGIATSSTGITIRSSTSCFTTIAIRPSPFNRTAASLSSTPRTANMPATNPSTVVCWTDVSPSDGNT